MASSVAGPSQQSSNAVPQWRRFNFFDAEEMTCSGDTEEEESTPRVIDVSALTIPTSDESPLSPSLISASSNQISILDARLETERSFQAWEDGGRTSFLVEASGYLAVIGEEQGNRWPVLKIWDLTKEAKRKDGNTPRMMRHVTLQQTQRPHPVSSFSTTSNLSHLAIGLGDGTVMVYRHLLQSLKTSPTSLAALPKAKVVHQSPQPVTGLGFYEPDEPEHSQTTFSPAINQPLSLFIVTPTQILNIPVSGKSNTARVLDEIGTGIGCAVMDRRRHGLLTATDEGLYSYDPQRRVSFLAHEGTKSKIAIYRRNLVVISRPSSTVPSKSNPKSRLDLQVLATGSGQIDTVTIFDIPSKLISFSSDYRDGVIGSFAQGGYVLLQKGNGKIIRLQELSVTEKLDILYRRNMYSLAIEIAQVYDLSAAATSNIHKEYGDYLYDKGDYDGAMSQFVQTLESVPPSYVIRKYLDAQRIHNLIIYLQALHDQGIANPDHTTLLLNCYTKTGDHTHLDAFVKTEVDATNQRGSDALPFDLDTAIRVCRQAGFYDHALYLAKRWSRHEEYLRIQIEDAGGNSEALDYLRALGPDACCENLLLYGSILLRSQPLEATQLFIDLCSGTLGSQPAPEKDGKVTSPNSGKASSTPAMLSYLGVNRVAGMFTGESSVTAAQDGNGQKSDLKSPVPDQTNSSEPLVTSSPAYEPPSPRTFFTQFVDSPNEFVLFLESVAANLWDQTLPDKMDPAATSRPTPGDIAEEPSLKETDIDQRAVWNTLLELQMSRAQSAKSNKAIVVSSRGKALSLLSSSDIPYDPLHALMLCAQSGFTEGLMVVWESLGMYEEIIRFWINKDTKSQVNGKSDEESHKDAKLPSDEVLRYLDLYGPEHPELYLLVLRYLTSSSQILARHPGRLGRLLQHMSEHKIVPPLELVKTLSRNEVTSVGDTKAWLNSRVQETSQDIVSDKHLVHSYRSETETKEKTLKTLADPEQPQVFQVTKCAACGGHLDLPSIHFMCKHSYHQRCLPDVDPECILCARQHSIVREVRRGQSRLADRHDLFLSEVRDAEDGFSVVASGFGRGYLESTAK